jgi:hypothetical protein
MNDFTVFALAEGYEDFSGGDVSLVEGRSYDVAQALDDGDGRIVLDSMPRTDEDGKYSEEEEKRAFSDGQIIDALKNYPGLEQVEVESGDTPHSYEGVKAASKGPTKAELVDRAAELDISGRSGMDKDELGEAIAKAEAEATGEADATGGDASTEGSGD